MQYVSTHTNIVDCFSNTLILVHLCSKLIF